MNRYLIQRERILTFFTIWKSQYYRLSQFEPNKLNDRLMKGFNWQHKNWPDFKFEITNLEKYLFQFYERVGHVSGILKAIPDDMQTETLLEIMVAEAVKTSEIEGEFLSRKDVLSSIRKNLGLVTQTDSKDIRTEGISSLMIDVRNSFSNLLTEQSLFDWHIMLLRYVPLMNTSRLNLVPFAVKKYFQNYIFIPTDHY